MFHHTLILLSSVACFVTDGAACYDGRYCHKIAKFVAPPLSVVIAMAKGSDGKIPQRVKRRPKRVQDNVRGRSPAKSARCCKERSKHVSKHKAKPTKTTNVSKRIKVLTSKAPVLLSVVNQMMKRLSTKEKNQLSEHIKFINSTLHTSSSCSGSGLPRVVEHYVAKKMKLKVVNAFACEKEPWKQRWNDKVIGQFTGDSKAQRTPCMHPDIGGLSGNKCTCMVHGAQEHETSQCFVRKSRVHSSGFSCKDMSKLHASRGSAGRNCLANQTGSSGNTLAGLIAYVKSHRPEILCLENVDDLLSSTSPNYQYLINEFKALGYVGLSEDILSSQYSRPQRRRRAYLIFYMCQGGMTPDVIMEQHVKPAITLAKRLGSTLQEDENGGKAKYVGPPLERFFLSPKHLYLQQEHARLRENRAKKGESMAEMRQKKGLTNVEADPWKETNRSVLAKMGISVSECVVPPSERGNVGYDLLTSREKFVLGHALLVAPNLHNADIYQSMGREFLSDEKVLSTIVPGSMKWIRPLKRLLLGYEALMVQGMPEEIVKIGVDQNFTDGNLMDLAGN